VKRCMLNGKATLSNREIDHKRLVIWDSGQPCRHMEWLQKNVGGLSAQ
jgi:hypothetical protein